MIAQLSTSGLEKQLVKGLLAMLAVASMATAVLFSPHSEAQASDIERQISALSAIDRQFMADQRASIERLANAMGRRLTGDIPRDLDTLQALIDRKSVALDDELTQQAMGVVFGDLLAKELDMDWVVYRDRAGRSRALQYRQSTTFLFPVTMISRRYGSGAATDVKALFEKTASATREQLPGARWR